MQFANWANISKRNWHTVASSSSRMPMVVLSAAMVMSGCSHSEFAAPSVAMRVTGQVHGGSQPISSSTIQLYAVGATGNGSAATPLIATPVLTDAQGNFAITGLYSCPSITSMVYISATGGNPGLGPGKNNPAIALIAALGACGTLSASTFVNINEVTTVGAVWPLQKFLTSTSHVGGSAGSVDLQNGFVNSATLVDTSKGSAQSAASIGGETVRTINTIADALAACINSDGGTGGSTGCGRLFSATTPQGGGAPTDTVGAALNLALNPTLDGTPIINLVSAAAPFQPVATVAPQDWSMGFHSPSPATFAMSLNTTTVFIGDSITAGWPLPINNKGINGDHAAQISARFSTDVLGHGYMRVIILAGTNDVYIPDSTSGYAVSTIITMAELARANGIQAVLCLIPPIQPYTGHLDQQVSDFNVSLAANAAYHGFLLVDYNTPLAPLYPLPDAKDGVHPTTAGYAVMETALSSVVTR